MHNESKIGMLAGVAVFILVAVFFQARPAVGTAFIGNDPTPAPTHDRIAPPALPPAGVTVPEAAGSRSTWHPSSPRENQPLSRDPLLWP